ncbi:MAG: ATP synthase F0 subunit B [Terracidiphilus sp.]
MTNSRSFIRPYGLVLLGLIAFAPALMPVRAFAAQVSEVPAQPEVQSPKEEAQNPPQTQAAKTEEKENDLYRHSGVVQSLARIIHLDVETTARLFEFFNLLVVVLGIGIPLGRFLPKLLRKRSEKIRGDLETARKTTEDANTRLAAVEAKLASLDHEIAKFRAEVEQQIALDEQRGKAALEEESARIVASAEQEIGVAAAQAKRSLRHFAADLAIDQAVKKLVLTPETDRALIAEFVNETGRDGVQGGGKN